MVDFGDSEEIKELLASYVLGDLTTEEVASVNQLLDSHPELKAEVSRLQKTLALFPLALPEAELPPTLGSRILQTASGVVVSPTASSSNQIGRRLIAWRGVIGSVAASVLLGLGFYSYHLHQQVVANQAELSHYRETIALLRQPSNRLLSIKGTEATPAASGSLVVVPKSETIVLALQNLTPLPKGKIYRLWGVSDGKKIYCGEFQPNPQGKVLVELPLDAEMSDSASVVITVEPSQKLSYPIGETVMTGSVSL
jgi:anti-sigma-K factor RskA